MNGGLAMRSTRLRTLLLVLVGGGMLLSLYLLTSSQYHLKDARHLLEACQQQKDSLLAQLQVVYEQKNRVEKSLQQEKLDHRKTQDDNQKNNFLRLQVQKAKVEVDTKLSALQKEQISLQERYHELESQTKELREQQIENERKRTKLQTDYEQNLRIKEEENTLLHGNLTLALQERDGLETQNVQLNNNIQQLKSDFLHYKRMYVEINQRLKKLSEQKTLNSLPDVPKANTKEPVVGNEETVKKYSEPVQPVNKLQQENQQMSNDVGLHVNPDSPLEHNKGIAHAETPQRSPDQRHPLPAPNIAAGAKEVLALNKVSTQPPPVIGGPIEQAEPEAMGAGQQPLGGLRQQLQPPDFPPEQAQHAQNSVDAPAVSPPSSPSQVAAGNQPLLPPPPQQQQQQQLQLDVKQEESPQVQDHVGLQHQEEQNHGLQSQEQRDQDTMARKPIREQNPLNPGLVGQDARGHESMFIGGAPQWNPFGGNLGLAGAAGQQQQIKSPEIKAKSNNNRPQEDEENYPEDGEDDNAEEQDDLARDKNMKAFQDHDFEDNDGNDHNQAKEEGIVIAPK